jgi:hypothetical protein
MNTISKINRKLSFFVILALLGASWLSFTVPVEATPNAVPSISAQFQTIPVERLLNPDSTLNLSAGGSGTLDLHGWDVTLDSKRGPILTRRRGGSEPLPKQALDPHARSGTVDSAVPLAPTWQALAHQGLYGTVFALAFIGADLYVGGDFQVTQDSAVTLNRIAKFSGGAWSALPHNGLNSAVLALAVSGSDLYVGGYFTQTADGMVTDLNNIARFSGGAWSALPNHGLNNQVYALAFIGSDLYVGGHFDQTFDLAVPNLNYIAKFSGGAWSALPDNGLNSFVYALAVSGSDLYVGGRFSHTADCNDLPQITCVTNLNDIAKFSGGTWSALPNKGLNSGVLALAFIGSDLYVGGDFAYTYDCYDNLSPTCVTNLNRIAKFSGGAWSALPNHGLNSPVNVLAVSGSDLYVGGYFNQTADSAITLNYIAKFSGGAWSTLPNNGLNHYVHALAVSGSDLYVGGSFGQTADGAVTNLTGIAKLSSGFNLFLPLVIR